MRRMRSIRAALTAAATTVAAVGLALSEIGRAHV